MDTLRRLELSGKEASISPFLTKIRTGDPFPCVRVKRTKKSTRKGMFSQVFTILLQHREQTARKAFPLTFIEKHHVRLISAFLQRKLSCRSSTLRHNNNNNSKQTGESSTPTNSSQDPSVRSPFFSPFKRRRMLRPPHIDVRVNIELHILTRVNVLGCQDVPFCSVESSLDGMIVIAW